MKYDKVLVLSDNPRLIKSFMNIVANPIFKNISFTYHCSFVNTGIVNDELHTLKITPIRLADHVPSILKEFNLLLSLHCKQIFPDVIVKSIKCINFHPGYNPYNRGWYPQAFSIINKKPFGITIHEIDSQIDHGSIIAQKSIPIFDWDTSLSVYSRAIEEELKLIEEYLPRILKGDYHAIPTQEEGNLNNKKDFQNLCQINLTHSGTFQEHIDILRALSHGDFKNAFFITKDGRKVFLKLNLENE